MRTKLRGKVTLLFVVSALLLAIPAVAALAQDTGTSTAAPTIQSDKDDYSPGELVTLTGSGWKPGESVNIVVNDDAGQTWNRNVNVIADPSGSIGDSFNLPDWFVATYSVKATGASGAVATSSFTDSAIAFTPTTVSQSIIAGSNNTFTQSVSNGNTPANVTGVSSSSGANGGRGCPSTANRIPASW